MVASRASHLTTPQIFIPRGSFIQKDPVLPVHVTKPLYDVLNCTESLAMLRDDVLRDSQGDTDVAVSVTDHQHNTDVSHRRSL